MNKQEVIEKSVRKDFQYGLDGLVRHIAHNDLNFSMDLIGVPLTKASSVFESVAGVRHRHDISVVGELVHASEAMKSIHGHNIEDLIRANYQNQLILQIEWMTRMDSEIAWRQLRYVQNIQRQHPFFAHMVTVTLSKYKKDTIPVHLVCCKEGVQQSGVEVLALGRLDPFTWIRKEFPRRAVFVPVLRGGTSPKALRHALDILKTTLHNKNRFSLFALIRVLAEFSSCTEELIMAAKETNLEIPELSELAQEEPFLDKIVIAMKRWRKEGLQEGLQEGVKKGVKKGVLEMAHLMLGGNAQGLEKIDDIELLRQEIQRRFAGLKMKS